MIKKNIILLNNKLVVIACLVLSIPSLDVSQSVLKKWLDKKWCKLHCTHYTKATTNGYFLLVNLIFD